MIPSPAKYARPVIVLHWIMALLIVALYVVGLNVDSFDKPLRPMIVNLHALFGLLLLVLLALRVIARRTTATPAFPASMGPMFQRVATLGHGVLYLLMAATPLAGVPTFLFRGRALNFGLFEIPSPFEANRDLAHQFGEIHELLAHLLIATVVAHILVALYHQLVLRDGIVERMRP